jgi:hypothetical protein
MTCRTLLWLDERYDTRYASDGESRYGAYLRQAAHRFVDLDEPIRDAGLFAATAFEIGCSPIMSPPYVHTHPRAVSVVPHGDEDGRRALTVMLAIEVPTDTQVLLPRGWRGWQHPREDEHWYEPWDNDRPAVTTTLTVRVPFPPTTVLPEPVYDRRGNPDVSTAKDAVRALAGHTNAQLAGVLDTIGTTGGRWSR